MSNHVLLSAIFFCAVSLPFISPAWGIAQVDSSGVVMDTRTDEMKDFRNNDDEVIFTGTFSELRGSTAVLQDSVGNFVEKRLNTFCEEDREYIRAMEKLRRKAEKAKEQTLEILAEMDARNERSLISGCNKLKRIGPLAELARQRLNALMAHEEPRVKKAVIIAFLHICERSENQSRSMLSKLNSNTDGVGDFAADRPADFLKAFASLGRYGFPYIQQVAYTGSLQTERGGVVSTDVQPVTFDLSSSELNEFREAACEAMGEFTGEPVAMESLLRLLPTIEEPVNGVRDDKSLSALLRSLGNLQVPDERAMEVLERHKAEFENVVTRAQEQLTKAAEKLADEETANGG